MADGRKSMYVVTVTITSLKSRPIIKLKLKAYCTASLSTGFIWTYYCNTREKTGNQRCP